MQYSSLDHRISFGPAVISGLVAISGLVVTCGQAAISGLVVICGLVAISGLVEISSTFNVQLRKTING